MSRVIEILQHDLAMREGELARALMAIERVREIHKTTYGEYCSECDKSWPCETIQALEGEQK